MSIYEVVVTAVIIQTLRVMADSRQEAVEKARLIYWNDHFDIPLDEIHCSVLSDRML